MRSILIDGAVFGVLMLFYMVVIAASPTSKVREWWNACHIRDWTTECVFPVKHVPLPWCKDTNRDRLITLILTMKEAKTDTTLVPATCFGTNVQVYKLSRTWQPDLILINPRLESRDGLSSETKSFTCRGVERPFHTSVRVKYLDEHVIEHTDVFYNKDAAWMECEFEQLVSGQKRA